jgi:hypothetical protein
MHFCDNFASNPINNQMLRLVILEKNIKFAIHMLFDDFFLVLFFAIIEKKLIQIFSYTFLTT